MDRFLKVAAVVFVVYLLSLIQGLEAGESEGRADRQCYSCSGLKCLRQATFNGNKTCPNSNDDCVTTFLSMGGIAFRGCYSELSDTERKKCTASNKDLCHQCSSNLCNNVGPATAKCVTCTSSSDRNCLQDPKKMSPQACPLTFSMQSTCYVDASNGVTVRGCTESVKQEKDCTANPSLCYTCPATEANCNQITYPANRTKCYTCQGSNCKTSLTAEFCNRPDDSCIAMNLRGTQVKKCTKQLSSQEESFCRSYPRLCVECRGAQCNYADVNDNSTTTTTSRPSSNSTTTTSRPSSNSTTTTSRPSSNSTLTPPPSGNSTATPGNTTAAPDSAASLSPFFALLLGLYLLLLVE